MKQQLWALWTSEEGATVIEYVLLAALIALVAVGAIRTLGARTSALYENVSDQMAKP